MDALASPAAQPPRLLAQVRERARYLHYSLRTENAYLYWIRFFIRWNGLNSCRRLMRRSLSSRPTSISPWVYFGFVLMRF